MAKKLRKNKKVKKTRSLRSLQKNKNTQQEISLTLKQTYQFAVQHFQAGNLQLAEQFCRKTLGLDPENENANHLLGVIIANQGGRNDSAVGFIQKALEVNPNNAEAYKNLGELFQGSGRLDEAVTSFKKALSLKPEYVAIQLNLGNVFQGLNKLDEAIACYRKVLSVKPDYVEALNNLGIALQKTGKHKEAIASYRQALSMNPDYAEAHNNLGLQLQNSDNLDEAINCYRNALSSNPNYAEAHYNLGNALNELGEPEQAIAKYRKAVSLKPDYVKALNNMGLALHKSRNQDQAIASFKQALSINPYFAEAHNNLGVLFQETGEFEEARICFEKALSCQPDNAESLLNLGKVHHELGMSDEAIACLKKALSIDPDYAEAYLNLGSIHYELGRMEEAKACYKKSLSMQTDNVEAFRHLSFMEKCTEIDDAKYAMEDLYAREDITDEKKMNLGFAFGKIYSDLKEYDKSFNYILEANRLKRLSYDYSIQADRDFVERIKKAFTSAFFFTRGSKGYRDTSPIFILGMPRSGTTLTEQILSSHPLVFGAGELKLFKRMTDDFCAKAATERMYPECMADFDAELLKSMGSDYIGKTRKYSKDAQYITNKMPHNFLFVGLIRIILPEAKVIHCVRNPMDNCLSIFKNFFKGQHDYAYDMVELGQYYNIYLDLMAHWEKVLPGYMYTLRYEDMVSEQEHQSRRLLDFCDIPWDEACLTFHKTDRSVKTASLMQVRQPMYSDSVELWKRYEKQLEPLRKIIYGK